LSELDIRFEIKDELYGMGGIMIGYYYYKNELINGIYVEQSIINNNQYICFSKLENFNVYFRWQLRYRITVFDIMNKSIFQSKRNFKALCISRIENNIVFYKNAFNEKLNIKEEFIEFNLNNFSRLL
jgi:hypothetical protein